MIHSRMVSGVNLLGVMATTPEIFNLVVAQMLHKLEEFGVLAEEILPDVAARLDHVLLELTIDDFEHPLLELARFIIGENGIPVGTPDDLEDIPPGTPEETFKFLNDFTVTTDRPIETLQIAVDDPGDVIEMFASPQSDGTQSFGLIDFTIANKAPNARLAGIEQAAMLQITEEPGLIERAKWPQTHRNRGELPEVRHQPRMRIR